MTHTPSFGYSGFRALTDDDTAGAHQPDLLLEGNCAPGLVPVGGIFGGARRAASLPRTVRHLFPPLYLLRSRFLRSRRHLTPLYSQKQADTHLSEEVAGLVRTQQPLAAAVIRN